MAIKVSGTTVIDDSRNIQNVGIISATSIKKSGGTSSQFLKADGSVDTSTYLTSYTETQTLDDVTSLGNSTSNGISVGVLTATSISSTDSDITNLNSSGISTVNIKTVSEVSSNNFNSVLAPSSGILTIDTSQSTVFLGDINASVTTWAFTNVSTNSNRATTVTMIIDGDASQTYGDACSVNGSAITSGVKWGGGSAPTATDNFDIISFLIIKDGAGTINVFGSANTNFS